MWIIALQSTEPLCQTRTAMKNPTFLIVMLVAGSVFAQEDCNLQYDGNGDGAVNITDVLGVLSEFGEECEPTIEYGPCGIDSTISYHGYDYSLVEIGEQCWFAENLRTELYANGDSIPGFIEINFLDPHEEGTQSIYNDAWDECYLEPCNIEENLAMYGRLYTGLAVDDQRGLCPSGFHVPSDEDFILLEEFLGIPEEELYAWDWRGTNQGSMIKAVLPQLIHWQGTNESGFNGMPGGFIDFDGTSYWVEEQSRWWTSSPSPFDGEGSKVLRRITDHIMPAGQTTETGGQILRDYGWNYMYYSVRCLKDTE